MSKIAYSQFTAPEWRMMKTAYSRHSEADMVREAVLQMGAALKRHSHSTEPEGDATADMFMLFVYIIERFHRCQHYFVAPGVADFCAKSVKQCTPEYYRDFPATLPIRFFGAKDAFPFAGGMFFHFPANEQRESFYLAPRWTCPVSNTLAVTARAMIQWADGNYYRIGDHDFCQANESSERIKIILGLSLYMDAFPDAIVPAADHSVHHLRHYKGEQRQIGRAPAMEHEERCAVRPHFRRGHFRVLHSPKFTHKRGQTIFIAGTFVRGSAFDILDDAPPAKATQ